MNNESPMFESRDYRGATIEDLDIPPAISVNPSTHLNEVLELSYEHEFTYLPVIHERNRRLLGVLNVENLKRNSAIVRDKSLEPYAKTFMIWFNQKTREAYEREQKELSSEKRTPIHTRIIKPASRNGKSFDLLTPLTPLENLAKFFNKGYYFAIITSTDGKYVYGVATPEDLSKYEKARPKL